MWQDEGDKYKEMLNRSDSENIASNYFRSKRATQLLGGDSLKGLGKTGNLQTLILTFEPWLSRDPARIANQS